MHTKAASASSTSPRQGGYCAVEFVSALLQQHAPLQQEGAAGARELVRHGGNVCWQRGTCRHHRQSWLGKEMPSILDSEMRRRLRTLRGYQHLQSLAAGTRTGSL